MFIPLKEVEMIRCLPRYKTPPLFRPFDTPGRPLFILDMNGVMCIPWFRRTIHDPSLDVEAPAFNHIQEDERRCTVFQRKTWMKDFIFLYYL